MPWNDVELRLLRTVELFQHKPAIMNKAEGRLDRLRTSLIGELAHQPGVCPAEADRVKGQIVRGENLKGFPFISLDMPQLFNKQTFFTYRTLFWWGHYLGFSLILKGGAIGEYTKAVTGNLKRQESQGVWLSQYKTPWEWEMDGGGYHPLTEADPGTLTAHAEQNGYLKLMRIHPVGAADFPDLDWTGAGLSTYRDLTRLIQPG